ncbi:hypothetical protein ACIBKZ_32110 [Streptomyces sp. NPDC050421]|uniref:hypothetical protein n=1 Tax=Streptomyces sp. NPDC050421 TaxID=3365613 RepID=UPI0037971CE8
MRAPLPTSVPYFLNAVCSPHVTPVSRDSAGQMPDGHHRVVDAHDPQDHDLVDHDAVTHDV